MSVAPTVAVLVSSGRHPVSGLPRACKADAVAMAFAQGIGGAATRIIHAGDPKDAALKDYLSFGAHRIEVLPIEPGDDPLFVLVDTLRTIDLVITGARAETGQGCGLLPYKLAHILKRPVIADALEAQVEANHLAVLQYLPKGQRRQIAAPFSTVIAVHPRAPVALKYAYARGVAGHIEAILPSAPQETPTPAVWTLDTVPRQPTRLKAADHKSGHERMLSCIETPARGGTVAFDGSSVDKAQVLLTYLRENRIIDF
jgi:electron transfer flavoprotein beta subunit